MAPPHHWNWTGAQPLTADASLVGVAGTRDVRGNASGLSLFCIGTGGDLLNAQQRTAGDSTSWEVQPALSSTAPEVLAVAVKAKQFAVGDEAAGVVDLFVVSPKNEVTRFRQIGGLGTRWELTDPQPFAGQKISQLAVAQDAISHLQLVGVTTSGKVLRQRQASPGSLQWNPIQTIAGVSAKQVAIAADQNNQSLLEIFFIDHHNVISHLLQQQIGDDVNGWGGPSPLLPSKPTGKQMVVGQNADGRLELFCVDTNSNLFHTWQTSTSDVTQWSDKTRFAGDSANQVTVTSNQDGRLEIFYVGTDGNLYHNWQDIPNGVWVGETIIPGYSAKEVAAAQNAGDGHLEIFWIDKNNVLQHSWQTVPNSAWVNTDATGGNVPTLITLGGSANLILATGSCGLLTDVAVTISITEDLVFSANGKPMKGSSSLKGFSWQLNCVGRVADEALLQQYVICYDGDDIYGVINNWTPDPKEKQFNGFKPLINSYQKLKGISGHKIPAGFQFVITLNNDEVGNIVSATFLVIDPNGNNAGKKTTTMKSSIVGPIVDFQLNLVGPGNSESVTFSSGSGAIEYLASSILTASAIPPPCAGISGLMDTAEESNSLYGPMSANSSNVLSQTFSVNIGGQARALRERPRRPPLMMRSNR